jgi:hypothetical protein
MNLQKDQNIKKAARKVIYVLMKNELDFADAICVFYEIMLTKCISSEMSKKETLDFFNNVSHYMLNNITNDDWQDFIEKQKME